MATEKLYWVDADGGSNLLYDSTVDTTKKVTNVGGLGMPPINQQVQQYALLPGAAQLRAHIQPRTVNVAIMRSASSRDAWYTDRRDLATVLQPYQQGEIKYTDSSGSDWYMDAYVSQGPSLELTPALGRGTYQGVVTFTAPWPFWREGTTASVAGNFSNAASATITDTIAGDVIAFSGSDQIASFAKTITITGPTTGSLIDPVFSIISPCTSTKLDFSLGDGVSLVSGETLTVTSFPFDATTVKKGTTEIDEYSVDSSLVWPLPKGNITVKTSASVIGAGDGTLTIYYYPYYFVRS